MTHGSRTILCPFCGLAQCKGGHGAPYAVEDRRTGERGPFWRVEDVKTFMWGRDFQHYRIYKYGVRFPWLDGDLYAFAQALEAA